MLRRLPGCHSDGPPQYHIAAALAGATNCIAQKFLRRNTPRRVQHKPTYNEPGTNQEQLTNEAIKFGLHCSKIYTLLNTPRRVPTNTTTFF